MIMRWYGVKCPQSLSFMRELLGGVAIFCKNHREIGIRGCVAVTHTGKKKWTTVWGEKGQKGRGKGGDLELKKQLFAGCGENETVEALWAIHMPINYEKQNNKSAGEQMRTYLARRLCTGNVIPEEKITEKLK